MRIISRRVHVLAMTSQELNDLKVMLTEAEQGAGQHYSERQQPDGSYFGISVEDSNKYRPLESPEKVSSRFANRKPDRAVA